MIHSENSKGTASQAAEKLIRAVGFGFFVWKTNGPTPGKRLLRIRVLSLTHQRITLWQSIERALGYGASTLEAGFGFLQYFLYPDHRCIHDRIAETIVVLDPRKPGPLSKD